MVVGLYFTNWSIYARQCSPSKLPLDSVTHIFYAFGKPDPSTGEITLSDEWADIQKPMELGGSGCLGEFQLLKNTKFHHLRVLLSVGGYSYTQFMNDSLRDPVKRQNFVHSAVRLLQNLQLDGIDLDWEYPSTAEDSEAYLDVVKQLRVLLGGSKDLTIASPAGQHNLQFMDLSAMDPYISFWNVMTYDFAGPWSSAVDHHAALYNNHGPSVASVLDYYQHYIDPRKLVIGIPLYGRSFAQTSGLGYSFQGSLPGTFEQGVHDVKELPLAEFHESTDRDNGSAVCFNGRDLISYDNETTVLIKADFARKFGLAGAMFWEASGDRPNSLIRLFSREFHSNTNEH